MLGAGYDCRMKPPSGPALLKRKKRFEKCIVTFPDRADYYRAEIVKIEEGLKALRACSLCGRPLKGEESQARGYGPECMKKIEAEADNT